MADDSMSLLETQRKVSADGEVDVLPKGEAMAVRPDTRDGDPCQLLND